MLIKGSDCDELPISVKVSSACPHSNRHRQQGTKQSLLRASQRSHHFPSTQTRSQMTVLYWVVKVEEKALEPLICFLHPHSSSTISFYAEIILLALMAWLQALARTWTSQGKYPRGQSWGILHRHGSPQLGALGPPPFPYPTQTPILQHPRPAPISPGS